MPTFSAGVPFAALKVLGLIRLVGLLITEQANAATMHPVATVFLGVGSPPGLAGFERFGPGFGR